MAATPCPVCARTALLVRGIVLLASCARQALRGIDALLGEILETGGVLLTDGPEARGGH